VLLLAVPAAGTGGAGGQPQQPPITSPPVQTAPAPPPRTEEVVPLKSLVATALDRNLILRAQRVGTQGLQTSVQAAESAFDPVLNTSHNYTRGDQTLLLPGPLGNASGTQTLGVLGGGVSGRLPSSLSYSVSMQSDWKRQNNTLLLPQGGNPLAMNSTLTFSVTQPLLRGRGAQIAKAPIESAVLSVRSSQERLRRLEEETIAQVELAYWTLGLAEAIEQLSRDSYERAVELLKRNEQMRALELIAEVDLLTARQGVASRLTALTDATRQRRDATERLIFLVYGEDASAQLGAGDVYIRTEPPPIDTAPLPPMATLETQALAARRDVLATQLEVERSEVDIRVARNALLPDLGLTASYSAQTFGTDNLRFFTTDRIGDLQFGGWSAGVVIGYPWGNNFAKATHAQARLARQQQELVLASVRNSVRNEVREAARAILSDRERLQQAQQTLQLARAQYEAGQRQLQLDLVDSFRLLQIEEEVASAELTVVQVQFDLARAIASYEAATATNRQKYAEGGGGR
jgi:outer membrane protein TolC